MAGAPAKRGRVERGVGGAVMAAAALPPMGLRVGDPLMGGDEIVAVAGFGEGFCCWGVG